MNTPPITTPSTKITVSKASVFGSYKMMALTSFALLLLAIVGSVVHQPLLIPPIAATAVYIFGMPGIPGTQPRSVVFGHVLSAVVGFGLLALFGHDPWVAALAAGLAGSVMNVVKLFHIPAVATAALVVLLQPNDPIVFLLLLAGASIILSLLGWVASTVTKLIKYPLYW